MGIEHNPSGDYSGVRIQFHIATSGKDRGLDTHKKRYEHYDGHFNDLINKLKDLHNDHTASDCLYAWSKGDNAPSAELDQMVAVTQTLSPEELQEACDKGLITQDEANGLIVLGGLATEGYKGSDLQLAMKNFYAMNDADQQSLVKVMSNRDVNHEVEEHNAVGKTDHYYYHDTPGEMDPRAVRAAIFLANAKPEQLGNMREFVSFDYQDTDYDCVAHMKSVDNWNKLGDTEKHDLEKMVDALPAKTAEQAAVEGYGSSYHLYTRSTTMQGVKEGVEKTKDAVDAAIQDLQTKAASGEDVELPTDQASMVTYLQNVADFKSKPQDVQEALADYALAQLSQPAGGADGADGYTALTEDQARAKLADSVDGWDQYTPEQQNTLVQYIMAGSDPDIMLDTNGNYVKPVTDASGNVLTGADGQPQTVVVSKNLTPSDMRGMGIVKQDIVDVGTLMFLVLMDRMESQDDLIRGYTEDVDKKNQDLKNATAAQAALRASNADNGDVDITDTYFTDQSGNEVSVYDYCQAYGVDIPQDSNGNAKTQLNSTEMDNLLTSMKSYSDTLSTDAQSALQKLQQATDRYSNTNSLLTNFESAWRGMLKEVIGNIRA